MAHSTKGTKRTKPSKPYEGFPLFAHATGRWAKKINGRLIYFGKWDDPDAALKKYLDQRDDLHAGRAPRPPEGATVKNLCDRFLTAKERLLISGELSPRTFKDYHRVALAIASFFGRHRLLDDLRPDDFGRLRAHLAKRRGPVALGNEINRVRILFKFAVDTELTERTIRYGGQFDKPTRKTLRKARATNGRRTFEAADLRRIIAAAESPMKAFILLGVNCGMGQTDVAELPIAAIDFKGGWLEYPRPKTGIERRIPLWPETAAALKQAIAIRPEPAEPTDAGLAFLTRNGRRWVRIQQNEKGEYVEVDALIHEFQKLLNAVGDVPRLGFYSLRHTHRTVSDGAKDQPAANAIMGHVAAANDMSAIYRESIADERLKAITDHVRRWLWPRGVKGRAR